MSQGPQGPQGAPSNITDMVDFAVSATLGLSKVEPEDMDAVVQLLARAVTEQLKPLIKSEMLMRKTDDAVEARVEFYAVPRAAMSEILSKR